MKKYLLGFLTVLFSLIAFSSADNLNISCEEDEDGNSFCNPFYITLNKNSCEDGNPQITLSNFSCEFSEDDVQPCGISLITYEGTDYVNISYYDGELSENVCNIENDNTEFEVHTYAGVGSFNGTLTIQGNTGGNEGGNTGGNEGGNTGGGDDNIGGGVISDGFGSFTPVITGIKDTIFQLIPLVVYIGIGVLIVTLGFFAIRWLVNWIGGKINSYFNSKRD